MLGSSLVKEECMERDLSKPNPLLSPLQGDVERSETGVQQNIESELMSWDALNKLVENLEKWLEEEESDATTN